MNDGAPGGAEQSEVAAAVAEARAEGEKQRVGDGDDDFDDVRAELDAAGEDPPVHLSAAKEKRLEKRGLKKPVRSEWGISSGSRAGGGEQDRDLCSLLRCGRPVSVLWVWSSFLQLVDRSATVQGSGHARCCAVKFM